MFGDHGQAYRIYHSVLESTACAALADDPDSAHRIVIATHASFDRLEQVAAVAGRWQGCVSLAVAACSLVELVTIMQEWERSPVRCDGECVRTCNVACDAVIFVAASDPALHGPALLINSPCAGTKTVRGRAPSGWAISDKLPNQHST
jgi:hypothetical protein